ncbi:glycosyl transferase family 1 [Nostoc linckia z18]|uniref:Glycosyl transferase family 1 n=2 Tax=Nostoc linckia TaxID=92942 RepID=A0A9Q5Z5D8_NOSLI|nr:glycosyltransferase family 4 protein [Nostoc linckia]PHK34883.1 glycosyl transferase family 1 [Nostoc linckia z15]PHK47732.1 glycosyl transferase family 1 [Nostoc linckia z16]PHJ65950.1 glycosyl transferase family 1 [Nostoc linckia z1]PHJ68857.1 glycosyl transferase family 1 [Nostoc linckia z3]PHJ74508.1 glycosyl transferase family 1 [Nostoc linckia z2]
MKILHVCAIGGTVETLLRPQIDYFLSQNLSVEIACSPSVEVEKLQQQGYIIHPIEIDRRISPLRNLSSIYQLTQLIRQKQYDLVHVHTPIAAVLGRIAAKLAGVKRIVYTAHGFPFHDRSSPREYRFYFAVEKLTALITDLILTQNYEDIGTAKKLNLCPPTKLRYLGNGVDIHRFQRDRLNYAHQIELRKSLGIPDYTDLIIGTIGRLTQKKGSGYLIEAAAKLLPYFPNLQILVIGSQLSSDPEPFQKQLIQKIHDLGLEKHVILTGERRDIPELLGLLDIFTLPTFTHEGLPRSILEAMSMNLPVVATDIRGCREAVIHGRTGLIVAPKNTEKLAEALGILLSNSQLRQSYGQAGRQRVEADYDEELVFKRLNKYYQELGIY